MERKFWTLFVVNAAGPLGLSSTQLQKSLFLVGQNLPTEVGDPFYNFTFYDCGPFDSAIYVDAHTLAQEGLVEIKLVAGQNQVNYAATPEGQQVARSVVTISPRVVRKIYL